nr:immunoglobulin light chain junction region [Macaca mulatta]MOW07963.1 immunoglobulin light chain junction region [Macaca mulatta]MOW08029.1 immunoglobulin light chain junction region [Macaca mulatta]MOW08077.1 immunoglobulin light chain junction region [Macaca mulatta]MOW08258.1 immunoglobulin light chain junction region [Macaca mulatta]
CGQGTNVPFSF